MILLTGCISQYKYFPTEPQWASNPEIIAYTNDTYIVSPSLVTNFVYQKLYIENINDWRKNNGIP